MIRYDLTWRNSMRYLMAILILGACATGPRGLVNRAVKAERLKPAARASFGTSQLAPMS